MSDSKNTETPRKELIVLFDDVKLTDIPYVGGKNASLGEMIQSLTPLGVDVPNGFAVTTTAYRLFLKEGGLEKKLKDVFEGVDVGVLEDLARAGAQARALIMATELPAVLAEEIRKAYSNLCERYGSTMNNLDVAVRSSATAEDLPEASFAGQQETFLNINNYSSLLASVRGCFASTFTDRAIHYRSERNFDHFAVALSVGVQKMVRSDLACSGVTFSIDTESGFEKVAVITASWGLGENVVQGRVTPDEYVVFKPTLEEGYKPIIEKKMGLKDMMMVYDLRGVKNIPAPLAYQTSFCLTDDEVIELAKWVVIIENHYSELAGHPVPVDVEFAKDGITGKMYIVQARPETVVSQESKSEIVEYTLLSDSSDATKLAVGLSVGRKIGSGKACVISNVADISQFIPGDVLVTSRTDPDWEPVMKLASAIVTDQGGRTCHAAIISRELGIPTVVGTVTGTASIKSGQQITVCCHEGGTGFVYDGALEFEKKVSEVMDVPKIKTNVMMNIGNPEEAFRYTSLPVAGVGLARLEFIIASIIKVHPLALLHFDQIKDRKVKKKIEALTSSSASKVDYFVDTLARGIATIASAFHPRPAIVRLSDFKTNEYANLLGGAQFEADEANPMIGFRGCSRYYHKDYKDAFALECRAFVKARNEMGLTNIIPMVPFCRTPEEGKQVLKVMEENGLVRGKDGLKVYMMCEVPSNVILASQFAQLFDGFSIGSNDLTQLVLGLDRDSSQISHLFDERNEAVKEMIHMVIKSCRETNTHIGICGQAPSDYPEITEFLVREGINSISLSPDTVIPTILRVHALETELEKEKTESTK